MPDLASMLMRTSIGALTPQTDGCQECHRTPLAGERLHELESGRTLCELCFVRLPDETRLASSSQRVGASERRLAVVRRAA